MGQTATNWWKPAVTPLAAALLAFGTGTMAFAGVELVSSTTDAPPPASPVVSELSEAAAAPVADGASDAPPPSVDEGAAAAPSASGEETEDTQAGAIEPGAVPDLDDVAEVAAPVAGAATDLVEDAIAALPNLGGMRASGGGPPAHAGGAPEGGGGPPDHAQAAGPPEHAQAGPPEHAGGGRETGPPAHSGGERADDSPSSPAEERQAGKEGSGTPDAGDNAHPSGRDRSVEPGGSGTQGGAQSDPDDDGRGPDRSNGGADQPGGPGGVDQEDQDGNNGCGNDDDFEDDNEGWCGRKPKPNPEPSPGATSSQPGATEAGAGEDRGQDSARTSSSKPRRERNVQPSASQASDGSPAGDGVAAMQAEGPPAPTVDESAADRPSREPEQARRRSVTRAQSSSKASLEDEPERRVRAQSADKPLVTKLTAPVQRVALAAASTVGSSVLAFTGLEVWVLTLIGGSAIASGGALLRASRRREASADD